MSSQHTLRTIYVIITVADGVIANSALAKTYFVCVANLALGIVDDIVGSIGRCVWQRVRRRGSQAGRVGCDRRSVVIYPLDIHDIR